MAPVHADVDVDIGVGDPLWIDEPLEEEVESERLNICDAGEIRNDRPGSRTPPWPHRNIALFGPIDEVVNDQHVIGHPLRREDVELILKAILHNLERIFSRHFGQLVGRVTGLDPFEAKVV